MRHSPFTLLAWWLASWLLAAATFPLLSWHSWPQGGDLCLTAPAGVGQEGLSLGQEVSRDTRADPLAACGYCLLGVTHPGHLPHAVLAAALPWPAVTGDAAVAAAPATLFWSSPPVRAPPAYS